MESNQPGSTHPRVPRRSSSSLVNNITLSTIRDALKSNPSAPEEAHVSARGPRTAGKLTLPGEAVSFQLTGQQVPDESVRSKAKLPLTAIGYRSSPFVSSSFIAVAAILALSTATLACRRSESSIILWVWGTGRRYLCASTTHDCRGVAPIR